MGMILECYAVELEELLRLGDNPSIEEIRDIGIAVASVSINSTGAEEVLEWLQTGPLTGLDLNAAGTTGVVIQPEDLPGLMPSLRQEDVIIADISTALADAAEEAQWRGVPLWVGLT